MIITDINISELEAAAILEENALDFERRNNCHLRVSSAYRMGAHALRELLSLRETVEKQRKELAEIARMNTESIRKFRPSMDASKTPELCAEIDAYLAQCGM